MLITVVKRLKWDLRSFLAQFPSIYLPLTSLRGKEHQLVVDPHTDLVIDGYPRSGNTFALIAFTLAQPGELRVGHHLHAPAQVIWSVKNNIPVLVLIRQPINAVISFLIYERFPTIQQSLRDYIRYYRKIMPFREGFVIARFEEVTEDFGEVIQRVNSHFGTNFHKFKHTDENVQKCFELIEILFDNVIKGDREIEIVVGRPSPSREALKVQLKTELLSPTYQEALSEAWQVYYEFTGKKS
ncbi:MAG: hypothetical protein AMJ88_07845 [Anaerolineae bacterium SM23_ 63]|nr:MAG: hypothetical protein AMJ88_07845 [Anaerolineae bacterium SM23_ 63]